MDLALGVGVTGPTPSTRCSAPADAANTESMSPKCSISFRSRIGPTPEAKCIRKNLRPISETVSADPIYSCIG